MPRRSTRITAAKKNAEIEFLSQTRFSNSSDEEESSAEIFLYGRDATKKKKSRKATKSRGRKSTAGPSRQKTSTNKRQTLPSKSTSLLISDTDEEEATDNKRIQNNQEDEIKKKLDTFFDALDSDDDIQFGTKNDEQVLSVPHGKKDKPFYEISSDSEPEDKPSTSASTSKFSFDHKPETLSSSTSSLKSKGNKPNNLFDFVDDILKDCDLVNVCKDKIKENIPVSSLEDLVKKTNDIIGNVSNLVGDLQAKPEEPKKNDEKEPPCCPICLETLDGNIKIMVTMCGHLFCEPCIIQVAKTVKKCPTCRKTVTKTKYHPIYI
ncbi:pre-mRNA-splicing factor CWC24-like [Sitophilus oryzae]|uniref:Pre-mRNA-splicing factor CWC24-like n=1 Tax=Sitophilus oryzae TaxID=7048 RepID=A0A6J2Y3C6_SITOR|nr:pre-mRNA-splicing factor CWC24-like [Sitophilus oryzae]